MRRVREAKEVDDQVKSAVRSMRNEPQRAEDDPQIHGQLQIAVFRESKNI